LLFGIAHIKWDEVESDDEDEPVEMCPHNLYNNH
jgi:hypothetical protein